MRTRILAAHVLPITSAPIADGWVDLVDGCVAAVGRRQEQGAPAPDRILDLGSVAVLPGLVNAHTHLELSHLRGRVPPSPDFMSWVTTLLRVRAAAGEPDPEAMDEAIREAHATGTAALGDIGNTTASVEPLRRSPIDAWHFHELLGFREGTSTAVADTAWGEADARGHAGHVRCGVAPHAPYSTAPELIAAVVSGLDAAPARRSSVHLGESPEELQLLADGSGPWRDLLESFGAWNPAWPVPACSPVTYFERLGVLHPRLLVVHGTQFTREDLDTLAASGVTLVLCARSNAWVGVGAPPVADAFASGVHVAVGTDSLASVSDLNLFNELASLHALAPSVPPAHLLRAASLGGAEALDAPHLGAIEPGRSDRLIAVQMPARVVDPEAWLVSGAVTASDIRWVHA